MKQPPKKPLSHTTFVLLIGLLVLIGTGGVYLMQTTFKNRPVVTACNEEDGVRMCLGSPTTRLAPDSKAVLTTEIINTTDADIKQTFSCTHTDPLLYANDLPDDIMCGAAITEYTLPARSSETFKGELDGSRLKSGDNTVKAKWGPYESAAITIRRQ